MFYIIILIELTMIIPEKEERKKPFIFIFKLFLSRYAKQILSIESSRCIDT